MSRAFTPRAVAALEPRITALTDRLIDEVPGDLDAEYFAEPVPVAVIADLIGVPPEDRATFRAWSRAIMSGDADLRDAATAEFGMSGSWPMHVEWDGPAGRGAANFEGAVQ